MKIDELFESNVDTGLKTKSEKSGVSLSILRSVYNRGLAAWRSSHRPGTTPNQWAMARVNSFTSGGKTRTTADKDLWQKHTKTDESLQEEVSPAEQEHRQELYGRWKELINMSASSIEKFKETQTQAGRKDPKKYPGMKQSQAASLGISSGVQSASWIIKMKQTPVKEWTPEMWKWAGKQVSFVSRMLGNSGPLKDENGEPTRKLLSLKIWGHNPL